MQSQNKENTTINKTKKIEMSKNPHLNRRNQRKMFTSQRAIQIKVSFNRKDHNTGKNILRSSPITMMKSRKNHKGKVKKNVRIAPLLTTR